MSRELKFRSWHEDFGVMYFSEDYSNHYEFGIDDEGVYCLSYDSSISSTQTAEKNRKIMQFTGLIDKNGTKIYEGDIFSHSYYVGGYFSLSKLQDKTKPPTIEDVENLSSFRWKTNCNKTDIKEVKIPDFFLYLEKTRKNACYESIDEVCGYIEIIGNVYESPELLEKPHEEIE